MSETAAERVRYHLLPQPGLEAMTATTARSYPRHTHDQYGIGIVDAGGHGSWSGAGHVEAGPGSFITVNPGEVHDGHALGGRARSWRMVYFEPTALRALFADVTGRDDTFEFAQPVFGDGALRAAFEALFAQSQDPAPDGLACESAALTLLAGLQRHGAVRPLPPSRARPDLRRARDRLDADPAAPVSLAELAADSSLSRFQLLRAFTRAFGLPPHAYLLQQRLALARRLLRARLPLAEVAAAAGFSDQSHLTRSFTRQFALTPGRYASAR